MWQLGRNGWLVSQRIESLNPAAMLSYCVRITTALTCFPFPAGALKVRGSTQRRGKMSKPKCSDGALGKSAAAGGRKNRKSAPETKPSLLQAQAEHKQLTIPGDIASISF